MRILCDECFKERRQQTEPEYPACKARARVYDKDTECDQCALPAKYVVTFFMNGMWQ